MKAPNTMPNPNKTRCLYYVLGKCARNDEGIPINKCKRICEFFLDYGVMAKLDYPDNTYNDCGFNGMKEEDYTI